jgi:FkbM family methyltransferase
VNFSSIPRDRLTGKLLRLPLSLLPDEMVVPVMQGPIRGKKWIVGSGNHGCWLGSYEAQKVKAFADALRGKRVVYDLGANVGYYSLIASVLLGRVGHVIAFEPDIQNIVFFRRHLSLNDINNIQIVDAAVSDQSGTAVFRQEPGRSMGRLSEDGGVTVRTIALDDFIRESCVPAPDVMKIDVEGAEMCVLRGAERTLAEVQPLIFLATHAARLQQESRAFLSSLGYTLMPIRSGSLEISDELIALPKSSSACLADASG